VVERRDKGIVGRRREFSTDVARGQKSSVKSAEPDEAASFERTEVKIAVISISA
jgi:hypothetical protein